MSENKTTTRPYREQSFGAPKQTISEMLVDFSQPLLKLVNGEITAETFKGIFQIAVTVWNAAVFDHLASTLKRTDVLKTSIRGTGMPLMEKLVDDLIERKRTLYAHDLRLIGDYEVSFDSTGELEVKAEARILPSAVN